MWRWEGWRDYNPAGWSGVEHHALRPNLPTMGGFSPLRTSSNREQQIVTAVHPFPDPLQTHSLNPDLRLSHYQHFEWHFWMAFLLSAFLLSAEHIHTTADLTFLHTTYCADYWSNKLANCWNENVREYSNCIQKTITIINLKRKSCSWFIQWFIVLI